MTSRILLLKTAACVFCAALFLIRVRLTGSTYFSFMLWNLFLAALPLVFAWFLPHTRRFSRAIPLLAVWLLFFPNAPYVRFFTFGFGLLLMFAYLAWRHPAHSAEQDASAR